MLIKNILTNEDTIIIKLYVTSVHITVLQTYVNIQNCLS